MRSFQLLRLALEAEGLRLRHKARRMVSRLVFGYFALALVVGTLGFLHVAAWFWLRLFMAGQYVALIFAGVDLVLAAIFGLLASRSSPGRLELEALDVRRRALQDAAGALSMPALLIRAIEMVLSSRFRR
jgi:hypothetical protein